MSPVYLYGVMESGDEAGLGVAGIDGVSPVRIVARDGLGGVVSDYNGAAFGALAKENLVRGLLAHQRVVEEVMRHYPVLPVKFGTLLRSADEVVELLSQAHAPLAAALAAIQDRVEVEVAATWDTGRVLQEMSQNEEVVRAREAMLQRGQPTVGDQISLGQIVKGCLDQRRDGYRERMMSFLQPLAVDVAPNPLVADELVMNVAFLVERARQQEFEAGVERLDQLFQNEITFRLIGPLPPYSFSTVEVKQLTGPEVEQARQTLGLGERFTGAEARTAYRRLAAAAQRGLAQGDGEARARFARLGVALEVLLGYCANHSAGPEAPVAPPLQGRWTIAIRRREEEVARARYSQGPIAA